MESADQIAKPAVDAGIAELEATLARVRAAQQKYASYSQEQVDAIFKAAALAANCQRIPLAKMAVAETGMGIVEDKIIKNHFAAEYIYNTYKNTKTCGVIEENLPGGMMKIAEPIGVIGAVIPTTNPTSTAIFKTLLALKTRNGIMISPHPRAKNSTIAAAKLSASSSGSARTWNASRWAVFLPMPGSEANLSIRVSRAFGKKDMLETYLILRFECRKWPRRDLQGGK